MSTKPTANAAEELEDNENDKQLRERRQNRMGTPASDSTESAAIKPETIEEMMASGLPFKPEDMAAKLEPEEVYSEFNPSGYSYRVSPPALGRQAETSEFLRLIPNSIVAYALSYDQNERTYSVDRAAVWLNRLLGLPNKNLPDTPPYTTADFEHTYAFTMMSISDDISEAMVSLVIISLGRRNKDITREQIEEWLDVPNFIDFLRLFLAVHHKMKDRF